MTSGCEMNHGTSLFDTEELFLMCCLNHTGQTLGINLIAPNKFFNDICNLEAF